MLKRVIASTVTASRLLAACSMRFACGRGAGTSAMRLLEHEVLAAAGNVSLKGTGWYRIYSCKTD